VRFVLDASVTLSWVLENPVPAYASLVKQKLLAGARAVVPALWHLELANGLAVAERRRILTFDEVNAAVRLLEQLAAAAADTEDEVVPLRIALETARTYVLSAYDALYLGLAKRLQLPLATLDRALKLAAAKGGVQLF
jgi:predicted nucleic acid-binding protein